jgi:hypothetical protein
MNALGHYMDKPLAIVGVGRGGGDFNPSGRLY